MEKRILLDFEVEAHGCLTEGLDAVVSRHPVDEFEVTISNLAVDPGTDRPLLSVQLILPGEDLRAAEKPGTEALRRYLHYLTFVTNLTFRIHRLVRIVDWTLGLRERSCLQLERFPGHGLPFAVVGKEHIRSAEILQKAELDPGMQRALKWFSAGVSATYSDDQFQFFWLVIELIAQSERSSERINDLCPQCQAPLYCENCEAHPTHRPYPKQAIEQLFSKLVQNGAAEFFRLASNIRNAIMHGEPVDGAVSDTGRELSEIVDDLGKLAWAAILKALIQQLPPNVAGEKLALLQTNMYSHQTLHVGADLVVVSRNPEAPTLDELAMPEISIIYSGSSDEG